MKKYEMPPLKQSVRLRFMVAASALVVLAILAITAVALGFQPIAGSSAAEGPAPAASAPAKAKKPLPALALPSATPAPAPRAGDQRASTDAAGAAITSLVSANNQILQRADGGTSGLEKVASGFVQGELQALAAERKRMGFKQVGDAVITSVKTRSVDLEASPPTVVLDVCVDATAIRVVDANGHPVTGLYQRDAPTLNVYGAQYLDGLWKITTHDIPDSAPCA